VIDPGTRITQYAESMRGLVNQAGSLMLQANDQINDGTFDHAKCAKAAQQLANLTVTAGLELAPLMIPCAPAIFDELEFSDFIEIGPDSQYERALSVAKSFVHDGAPSCVIPAQLMVFVPTTLRVYAKWFRVATSWPDLQSGTYHGRVRLTRITTGSAAPHVEEVDVTVDL